MKIWRNGVERELSQNEAEAWEQQRLAEARRTAVPEAVTARQARLALLAAGHLPAVVAALEAMPGTEGEAARIEWEYALGIERQSPLVLALAAQLGLTEAQVDALFVAAKAL